MPSVDLLTTTFSRLQKHAVPFVDTPDVVINRALDALEKGLGADIPASSEITSYDPLTPPNLTHSKPTHINVEGTQFPPELTYWNNLAVHLIRRAAELGKSPEEIRKMVAVNAVVGSKTINGYKFVPEAGVSIQGQDAAGAWKAISSLAVALGVSLEVEFRWYDKPEAFHPGAEGQFIILGSKAS